MHNLCCPQCGSTHNKRNGHTHYGKQNHQCLACNRQFVASSRLISDATKALVKKLLFERIPLCGICRTLSLSLPWLLGFIIEPYEQLPDDLNVQPVASTARVRLLLPGSCGSGFHMSIASRLLSTLMAGPPIKQ